MRDIVLILMFVLRNHLRNCENRCRSELFIFFRNIPICTSELKLGFFPSFQVKLSQSRCLRELPI